MIKVGDWVKREHADGIVRVLSIEEDMAVLYTGGVQSCEYLEELTKLPIKFKGFKIVLSDYGLHDGEFLWSTVRAPKGIGHTSIQCSQIKGIITARIYNNKPHSNICEDLEQARDWLELQYATLLAKARGLV